MPPSFRHNSPQDSSYCILGQNLLPFWSWVIFRFVLISCFLISSSINGRLDCFHALAIVNNAVLSMAVWMHLGVSVSVLYYIPRSGIAEAYDNSTVNFLSYCFALQQPHLFTFHRSTQGFQFLHILINVYYFVFFFFFYFSPWNGCEVISHYGFGLHCSNDYWFWTSFHMLLAILFHLWRNIHSSPLLIF